MKPEAASPLQKILKAEYPEDLFGDFTGVSNREESLRSRRVLLARHAHPDTGGSHEAFTKLESLYHLAKTALATGTYGLRSKGSIITKRDTYNLFHSPARSDIADIYIARSTHENSLIAKVVRDPKNNDLLANEANVLKFLHEQSPSKDMPIMCHIAQLREATEIKEGAKRRKVNIIGGVRDRAYSLAQVKERYPDGLDPRDAAWMFNRLLGAIMATHNAGIVHGSIIPENFAIFPDDHGGMLLNWEYSGQVGSALKAYSPHRKDWYPEETFKKGNKLDFGHDIYMAAGCMAYLLGVHPYFTAFGKAGVPPRMLALLKACWLAKGMRTDKAPVLYEDFSEVLKEAYGPRKFRPFDMTPSLIT